MSKSPIDPTLDAKWVAQHTNRLLGFEILTRALTARYQPIEPEELADRTGSHKKLTSLIIRRIRKTHEQRRSL